jgi:chitinase
MADCSFMASQIKECQDKGKIVTLSLGGAASEVGFSTDSQARTFADNIWEMFLSGSGQKRPFGDAILDGYAALSFPSISGLNADIALFPFSVVVAVT